LWFPVRRKLYVQDAVIRYFKEAMNTITERTRSWVKKKNDNIKQSKERLPLSTWEDKLIEKKLVRDGAVYNFADSSVWF